MALCGYVRKRMVHDRSLTSNTSNSTKYNNEGLPAIARKQLNSDHEEMRLQNSRTMSNTSSDYSGQIERSRIQSFDEMSDQIRNLVSIQSKMKSELDQYKSDIENLKRQLI